MIRYKKHQNTNKKNSSYGKWYAHAQTTETFDITKLSQHMASHNSPYSPGVIKGLITDMVNCIKELLLDGKSVKLDDLAIFYLSIVNNGGAESAEKLTAANVKGVRMRCRATGNLAFTNLNLEAQLKEADTYNVEASKTDTVTETDKTGSDTENSNAEAGV